MRCPLGTKGTRKANHNARLGPVSRRLIRLLMDKAEELNFVVVVLFLKSWRFRSSCGVEPELDGSLALCSMAVKRLGWPEIR